METVTEDGIVQVHPVGVQPALTIDNPMGSIRVVRGESGEIRVRASDFDPDDGSPLRSTLDGDHLLLRTNGPHGPIAVDYTITVPVGCAVHTSSIEADVEILDTEGPVEVTTVDGDITARGVKSAALRTVDGDVSLHQAEGSCTITTTDGDVDARSLAGDLRLETTNGDATVTASAQHSCLMDSMNGDLTLEATVIGDGPFRVHGMNGDVDVSLTLSHGAVISLHTVNGEVHCNAPAEIRRNEAKHWEGQIDAGGPSIHLESVNGDVQLRARLGEETVAPAPSLTAMPDDQPSAMDAPAHDATVSLLARVERGELSVEEALAQLSE